MVSNGHASGNRRHEDDTATLYSELENVCACIPTGELTTKVFQGVLTDEELGTSVQGKDRVVQLLGDVLWFGECLHTGVVNDNIELTEVLDGLVEHLGDLRDLGDVGLDGDGLAAILLDFGNSSQRWLRTGGIVDNDAGTTCRQGLGKASTKTTAGTSDQGNFAIKADAGLGVHIWLIEGIWLLEA